MACCIVKSLASSWTDWRHAKNPRSCVVAPSQGRFAKRPYGLEAVLCLCLRATHPSLEGPLQGTGNQMLSLRRWVWGEIATGVTKEHTAGTIASTLACSHIDIRR